MTRTRSALLFFAAASLFSSVNVHADPIELLYLAGGELRSVGFDGTSFIGGYTSLETPNPEMSGISVIHAALSVSEPGTLALLSIGLLGMGLARLKRA